MFVHTFIWALYSKFGLLCKLTMRVKILQGEAKDGNCNSNNISSGTSGVRCTCDIVSYRGDKLLSSDEKTIGKSS